MKIFIQGKTNGWWTKPGEVCMADPIGEGGKWKGLYVGYFHSPGVPFRTILLPIWFNWRLVVRF